MAVISSLGATVPVPVSPLVLPLWYPRSDPFKFVYEFDSQKKKSFDQCLFSVCQLSLLPSSYTVYMIHSSHLKPFDCQIKSRSQPTSRMMHRASNLRLVCVSGRCNIIKMSTYTEMQISTSVVLKRLEAFSFSIFALSSSHFLFISISSRVRWQWVELKRSYARK